MFGVGWQVISIFHLARPMGVAAGVAEGPFRGCQDWS